MPPAPNRQTTGSKTTAFWVTHQTGNDRSILSRPPLVLRCSSGLSRVRGWRIHNSSWYFDNNSPMRCSNFAAAVLLAALPAFAQTPSAITYIPNSTVKLYQVNGDCDWVQWDATISNKTPSCVPTTSKTLTNADILGDDVPVVFENPTATGSELIVTFGDTTGALNFTAWSDVMNSFDWGAHDPIAKSTTTSASSGLLLNFFLNGNHGLEIQPPPQPNGMAVDMGTDNVPHAGISINGTIYLGIKTGNIHDGVGNNDQSQAYSLLATFNETTQAFTSGRTVSASPNGHFVGGAFYLGTSGQLGTPPPVLPEPIVLNFGIGEERASNVYLSIIPSTEFWTGLDQNGNSATLYFAGMSNGQPTWSANESAAVPIVYDPVNPTSPSINKDSVCYSPQLGLWLMMFDVQATSPSTKGMYFTYASEPWGPWSAPQLVFNDCRDKGLGTFIYYYYATAAQNTCPGAMPAGSAPVPGSAGPAGPTIGDQTANNPTTTMGHGYAPAMIPRFTIVSGNTLKLFYLMATWNPYATVMMESDFALAYNPVISEVANAEGESPTIAPNTWVEIKGSNLVPNGDSRIWQSSDFVSNQMPTNLDGVSATVNGNKAFVYYISPTQINILTPPNELTGPVQVSVSNGGAAGTAFTAQAQTTSPSFFVFGGGPYVAAVHTGGGLIGAATLYPGSSTPAKPGETIMIYANGFGTTTAPVVTGSIVQGGTLSILPVVKIGGMTATVQYAGLVAPGEFQFNVVVPPSLANGDQAITATYGGESTQAGTLITIHN
jgi:uncharacterized protein (TIGR03437 family)